MTGMRNKITVANMMSLASYYVSNSVAQGSMRELAQNHKCLLMAHSFRTIFGRLNGGS